jgi:hypothetical protein
MAKKKWYCQCRMEKPTGKDSRKWDIAWIPEKFAKVGKYIKIKQEDGTWDNGWLVTGVGDIKREESYLIDHERDYKNQRKASDV